ncbi:MAG: hypothetical protein DHS20C18_13590 [Saprospiraceae bacterium]|nr:MAG: hypothetical protein DHS20C18_13590 [Saprospiraceae bacterium]
MPKEKKQNQQESKDDPKIRGRVDDYMKYSGMAFQMAFIILIGTLGGKKLDEYFQLDKPYLTMLGAVLATFAALYLILKDIIFPKK